MDCLRAVVVIYWFVWLVGGAWMKVIERFVLSLLYRYLLTLLVHSWAEVVGGVVIGVLLSSFFWILQSTGDPSAVCVVYVGTFSYISGAVVVGFFVVAGFLAPRAFIDTFPGTGQWNPSPRSLALGAYVGIFCGLSLSFSSVVTGHGESNWCAWGDMAPSTWGFLMFSVGLLANSAYLPPLQYFAAYTEAEEERRRNAGVHGDTPRKKKDDEFHSEAEADEIVLHQ